ncbi:kinase-like domain-containing protein [Rhizophagus irregularis DAOM 181602=DAOM 197198]|nr:kinase-like domain-containing protein [Rhizophagus irregularis DAOM 181602=DAOM 197198]
MYIPLKYKNCRECKQENTGMLYCKACNVKHFQQNFKNWTSGNNDIDKFIQDNQLSANFYGQVLEWIPYNKLYDIEYIAKGGFGKVYRAKWIDGFIGYWDNINENWERHNSDGFVALKSLNNSENVTLEFINEITIHCKTISYGITQDPETKNYMMILEYAENGRLESIHEKELIHRDLHIGNILSFSGYTSIADMGLCKPADYNASENTKNSIYGVLPYIAPEVLRGQNYTKAADIYSFGIIMYEVISGLPPYHDVSHDKILAIKICQGLRPQLIESYKLEYNETELTELQKQIREVEEIDNSLPTSSVPSTRLAYETHSEAVYTSRLLNFNNLPEPKNSDDYYDEQNDNIISEKFSESLQLIFLN